MIENETIIRLSSFLGVFTLMAVWEITASRRPLNDSKARRWFSNLAIVVFNTLVVRIVFSATAISIAFLAAEKGWGLLNAVDWPGGLTFLVAVVALDFVLYLQHVMFHAVPFLWRFHMMHHADLDVDVTTGARFHPVEIIFSFVIKMAAIVLLGPPAQAVLIFEVFLNATSMFNHSNIRMPRSLDHALRWIVVTPDMHRIHHSILREETNSNFGFNIPWWDRLLGTYRQEPREGHEKMVLGLEQFRDPARLGLLGMLALPFTGKTGSYPMNRGGARNV